MGEVSSESNWQKVHASYKRKMKQKRKWEQHKKQDTMYTAMIFNGLMLHDCCCAFFFKSHLFTVAQTKRQQKKQEEPCITWRREVIVLASSRHDRHTHSDTLQFKKVSSFSFVVWRKQLSSIKFTAFVTLTSEVHQLKQTHSTRMSIADEAMSNTHSQVKLSECKLRMSFQVA